MFLQNLTNLFYRSFIEKNKVPMLMDGNYGRVLQIQLSMCQRGNNVWLKCKGEFNETMFVKSLYYYAVRITNE